MAKKNRFDIELGKGASAVKIQASMDRFLESVTPRIAKMTAKELQREMQPHILKAFKGVVGKWRRFLTSKGIDSKWDKPSGEKHIYDALVNGPMHVKAAGRYRKIVTWEILSAVDHLGFTLEGFGDVSTTGVASWGRMASVAAWANNKLGWKIPITPEGLVDFAAAKRTKMMVAGKESNALGAILVLTRAVDDTKLRSYKLKEALDRYITTGIFGDTELLGAFLKLSSEFDKFS